MSQNYLPDIPGEEKHRLESMLYPTVEVEHAVQNLPGPNWIAMGWGPGKGHSVARARAMLEHSILATQAARYHLYLAHYERLRLGSYSVPPNMGGGNVAAYFNFTSFSLHAVAAQMHLVAALATQHDLLDALHARGVRSLKRVSQVKTDQVYKHLVAIESPYATILRPFEKDKDWRWLRQYRDRHAHYNPMLVEEMGIQYSVERDLWRRQEHKDTGKVTHAIGLGSGAPPETNLEEMLTRRPHCFNILGKQLDSYTTMVRADIIRNWSNPHIKWIHGEDAAP